MTLDSRAQPAMDTSLPAVPVDALAIRQIIADVDAERQQRVTPP